MPPQTSPLVSSANDHQQSRLDNVIFAKMGLLTLTIQFVMVFLEGQLKYRPTVRLHIFYYIFAFHLLKLAAEINLRQYIIVCVYL